MIPHFETFDKAIEGARQYLVDHGEIVDVGRWQGMDISQHEGLRSFEALNYSFSCPIPGDLETLRQQVRPNLPWADDHFEERVGGVPLNPGNEYKNWPYYKHNAENDKFRTEEERFTHTYMERMWPVYAGEGEAGKGRRMNWGIRYPYGDLHDVVMLLAREPLTRQAYLPIWFPEDTGVSHRGRVPCTLGYHFLLRQDKLHITYPIRSCDYLRHFRDDIYLASRLVMWVLERVPGLSEHDVWKEVKPGNLVMHIGSFHVFAGERRLLERGIV